MLTLVNTVPEVDYHIILPIARQVLTEIVKATGYYEDMKNNIGVLFDTMVIGGVKDKNGRAAIPVDRVEAQVVPNINPANNKWDGGEAIKLTDNLILTRKNHLTYEKMPFNPKATTQMRPVFYEQGCSMSLVEDTIPCSFTLDTTFYFTERTRGSEAMSRILSVYTNGEMIYNIPLIYDYPVPETILEVMYAISKLRGIETKEFIQWLAKNSERQITMNIHRDLSKQFEIVVNRNHFNAVAQIEMGQESPTIDGEYVTFKASITVQFARANQMILTYPISVQNKPIPRTLVPLDDQEAYRQKLASSWQNKDIDTYYKELYPDAPNFMPYQYPWWDRWCFPGSSLAGKLGHVLFASFLITLDNLDKENEYTKINLETDLKAIGCEIDPDLLEYFKKHKEEVLTYRSLYTIGVFADDLQVDPDKMLEFDGTTLIIKNKRIDRVYRLVISKRKEEPHGTGNNFRVACVTIVCHRQRLDS